MTRTPTLQMLWETCDPYGVIATRFGHHDADAVARWVTSTLEARWGLNVDACERIVMSDHNALAWVATPAGPMVLKWSIATAQFPRLDALARLTDWLARKGLPVSLPIATLEGDFQVELDGVSLCLQRRIDGGLLDITQPDQVSEAGVVLGQLHDALAEYPGQIPDIAVTTASLSQGLFKVVVAAWCRVDTPWVRYKPGGHGGYRDRGGCLTSTADRSESCRARTRIFSHPGR